MEKEEPFVTREDKQLIALGRALKQLRKDKGISNYEVLAEKLGMARSQYSAYEQGKNLNTYTLFRILNFHEISIMQFCLKYLPDEPPLSENLMKD